MKKWPEFNHTGDLPAGIHQATLDEVLQHFGTGGVQRRLVGRRLARIYELARSTGRVVKFIVFGSFVTAKPEPADVDIFMLMGICLTAIKRVVRQPSSLTIRQHKMFWGPVFSGFGGWLRLPGSRKHFNTGRSNETTHDVA